MQNETRTEGDSTAEESPVVETSVVESSAETVLSAEIVFESSTFEPVSSSEAEPVSEAVSSTVPSSADSDTSKGFKV